MCFVENQSKILTSISLDIWTSSIVRLYNGENLPVQNAEKWVAKRLVLGLRGRSYISNCLVKLCQEVYFQAKEPLMRFA